MIEHPVRSACRYPPALPTPEARSAGRGSKPPLRNSPVARLPAFRTGFRSRATLERGLRQLNSYAHFLAMMRRADKHGTATTGTMIESTHPTDLAKPPAVRPLDELQFPFAARERCVDPAVSRPASLVPCRGVPFGPSAGDRRDECFGSNATADPFKLGRQLWIERDRISAMPASSR